MSNATVTRWLLFLREFYIAIINNLGKDNVVVDFLFILTNVTYDFPIEDYFLDEYLFVVSTYSPWYADIANYHAVGKLPYHLSTRKKRKFV